MIDEMGPEPTTEKPQEGHDRGVAPAECDEPRLFEESYVKRLRAESAGYRTRVRELEAAAEAKQAETETTPQVSSDPNPAAGAEGSARERELEIEVARLKAIAAHNVPEALREFVTAEDAVGAMAQAEKLATSLATSAQPRRDLPLAGGRNPANGGEQAAKLGDQERFEAMRTKVPSLNGRILQH